MMAPMLIARGREGVEFLLSLCFMELDEIYSLEATFLSYYLNYEELLKSALSQVHK